jgi:protein-S-isoprenylcysteine O-methyltransferase Ste14
MPAPDIKIPPPIIYLAFLAVGMLFGRVLPIPLVATRLSQIFGWLFAAASLLVAAPAFREFYAARTTVWPNRSASALMTKGVFALTRNPLYLSLLLLYCGIGIFFGAWWAIIIAPFLVAVINGYVIAREEKYLKEKFGTVYQDYCRRVQRWI